MYPAGLTNRRETVQIKVIFLNAPRLLSRSNGLLTILLLSKLINIMVSLSAGKCSSGIEAIAETIIHLHQNFIDNRKG